MQQQTVRVVQETEETKISPDILFVNQQVQDVWKREAPEHLVLLWKQKGSPQIAPLESRIHTYMYKQQERVRPKKVKLTTVFHDLINDVDNVASLLNKKNNNSLELQSYKRNQMKSKHSFKEIS